MIINIKRKISSIIEKLQNKVELNYKFNQDQAAYNQLLKMFDTGVFIPITKWAISPKEVVHICNEILINERNNIIEFGSGLSTLYIAQLLKIHSIKANFISVENDLAWGTKLKSMLRDLDLEAYVDIIICPLVDVPHKYAKKSQKKWYDINILEKAITNVNAIDLVIVDGPYGNNTPFARYSATPFLKQKLAENYIIFLDDSYRREESQIIKHWQLLLQCETQNYQRYTCLSNNFGFDTSPYV
jgi:hypothetical protein